MGVKGSSLDVGSTLFYYFIADITAWEQDTHCSTQQGDFIFVDFEQ